MVLIRNATKEQIVQAMEETNKTFEDNVIFNRFDKTGKNYNVTLKVMNSKGAGHRIGYTGRKMVSACWHVYGTFFDALLKINLDVVIISSTRMCDSPKMKIDKYGGNWQDYNVGSIVNPMMASEMCDCNNEGRF